MCQINS